MNRKLLIILCSSLLLLFISKKTFAQQDLFNKIKEMTDSVSIENLSNHIKILEKAGGHYSRVNFTPGNDSAVVYIKKEFEKNQNLTSVKLDTFYIASAEPPLNQQPLFNVIAEIKGALEGVYIISGHLDCSASRMGSSVWNSQWQTIKAPGADDNATGVASLLEIARILSDTSFNYKPDYTIKLIAFDGEEYGPAYDSDHLGSKHYAKVARENGENILGVINLDMFGYNNDYDYAAIAANINSKILGEKFLEARDLFGIELLNNSSPFEFATYSDHASFWDENYKAILIEENTPPWNNSQYYKANPYYHTSSDSFETLNMSLVKKITQVTLATTASFASKLTTDIENESGNIPSDFELYQNYPNPFNPTTKIKYAIPVMETGHVPSLPVELKVYNILGKEIATLVNQKQFPGIYEVEFSGSGLSSGIYFYKLTMGTHHQTKKMLLLK